LSKKPNTAFAKLDWIGGGESLLGHRAHPLSVLLSGKPGAVQTDEVEQELATRLGERQISQLVEDQEVEAAQEIRSASLSVGAGFGVQLVHQVHDVEEAAALATADAGPGDADGKVGFAGPGAADEDDVTLMLEELSGGQIARQRFVTGVSSKLNSSTSLAKGSLAMV